MTSLAIWIATVALTVLPILAELASGVTGAHLWTLETVIYAVLPITAIGAAFAALRSIRRAHGLGRAIVAAIVSAAILAIGCAPLLTLATLLTIQEFTPPV